MNKLLLTLILGIICSQLTTAQITLKAKITSSIDNEPLIGATVIIKGTNEGATTDFDGKIELKTSQTVPFTLVVSYLGYEPREINISSVSKIIDIKLEESAVAISDINVTGQRVSQKQKESPLTIESMDLLAIKATPSDNFYDGLGSMKGVDLTAASLGFKVINTRGFNSTSPVRSLQIIDGVDNQAPGLNFSLGNFLGTSELDLLKVDLVVGASSAFYGPNAFNGVISMETKNPFYSKGLSASVKFGERDMIETAIRYADVINNKNHHPVIGYKLNFSFLKASDWKAENYSKVDSTVSESTNPGGFDKVNVYGDEFYSLNNATSVSDYWGLHSGLRTWHRDGYKESDLVDYDTKNIKANVAIHIRTKPSKESASPELILSSSLGSGTTVYQGDNRFRLKNILFYQNRIEYRLKDKFFIRAYSTNEDAGDSYDPYFTA
ncbi:MAG TPA: carboxypeptidase-like regulatory domain-containing protein, partial [Saprospiraceae bacterium]|nr:carboxypeptidase-like regulatory domain-containing protein [Saprospiraceae bacterium]